MIHILARLYLYVFLKLMKNSCFEISECWFGGICLVCSPCVWGWSWDRGIRVRSGNVFPMRMGVILYSSSLMGKCKSVPHAYGGDPAPTQYSMELGMCSPCVWGWSLRPAISVAVPMVFPMRMGVILATALDIDIKSCVPHAYGGGDPLRFNLLLHIVECCPYLRRWSRKMILMISERSF